MKAYKKILTAGLAALMSVGLLAGCGGQTASAPKQVLKVGVTAGPHAEIMDQVKKAAAKEGLQVEVVEFNDYIQPNVALNQGDIDLNSFQHQPFLDNQIKDRGYQLTTIAKTVIFPMGVYSKKVKSLTDLQDGAVVAIPNDPTNGGRGLLLLQQAGLLKLKADAGFLATAADIIANPKRLKIKELDAAQIARSLDDVDAATVNTNYALVSGLEPKRDALVLESAASPYVNILVARTKDKDNPAYQKLIEVYHSPEIKNFINAHFKGSVMAAW